MRASAGRRLIRALIATGLAVAALTSTGGGEAKADHGLICVGPATIVTVTIPHFCPV